MKNKQSGFSLVEGLLVIIALAAVSFVGYYVWTNQTKNDVSNQKSASTKPVTDANSSTPASTATIAIPELGVSLTLPSHFSDITYTTEHIEGNDTNNPAIYANLLSKSLNALDSRCEAALGTLIRIDGQYQKPVDYTSTAGMLIKQFPDFNISYAPVTQYSCSQDAKIMAVVDKDAKDFMKALTPDSVSKQ